MQHHSTSPLTWAWLVGFVVLAGVSAWAAPQMAAWGWVFQALSVGLSLGALVVMRRVWQHRRGAQTLPPAAWKRLGWFTLELVAGLGLVAAIWLPYDTAYRLVHRSHSMPKSTPLEMGMTEYQTVAFPASDGVLLRGWYIPSHNGAVIIFLHGHGNGRDHLLADAAGLVQQGYGALLYDARAVGESEGELSTFGWLEVNDVRGAVEFVLAQPGVEAGRLGIMGHSQGAGTALLAAGQIPELKAVVTKSAYTSVEDNIYTAVEALTFLPAVPFAPFIVFFAEQQTGMQMEQVRPVDYVAAISPRPVLLIHGELDTTIPVENATQLYAAALDPKQLLLVPGAGHDDLRQVGGAALTQAIQAFFDQALLTP